ncbi:RNA polymerase sigma factor [Rothia sp. P4278]|uniref:RNA polymerase sigma factor n=1 Tax=Rothia sp. P4278 TaxID=3402658 RepID=UPI003AE5831D
MVATTPENTWNETMLADYAQVRQYVLKRMWALGKGATAEDVAQEAFITATRRLPSYDASKGNFQGWLMGIAKNLILQQSGGVSTKEAPIGSFMHDEVHQSYHPVTEDIGVQVTDKIVGAGRLAKIMEVIYAVSDSHEMVDRSMVLIRECDGDVKEAATRLGISPATLRHSHRQFQDLAALVDKALDVHWERRTQGRELEPVNVRELLECFPESDDAERAWLRTLPIAVLQAGGWAVDKQVLIAQVGEMTGYSPNTCRILINRCQQFYMIARSLVESGSL